MGEALWVILDKLLDNTTVKEYVVVWHEDLVVDSAVLHSTIDRGLRTS